MAIRGRKPADDTPTVKVTVTLKRVHYEWLRELQEALEGNRDVALAMAIDTAMERLEIQDEDVGDFESVPPTFANARLF